MWFLGAALADDLSAHLGAKKEDSMSENAKAGWWVGSIAVVVLIVLSFSIGMSLSSYKCIGFLDDGRKFVSTRDGLDCYLIGREIWVEKLPNGFYRQK